jgi:16S rRNA (cytosine1407-C5)-methyltransferase
LKSRIPLPISDNIQSYLLTIFSQSDVNSFIELLGNPRKQSIRVNTIKANREKIKARLEEKYNILTSNHPNIPEALVIEDDPENALGKTLEHLLGYYYIQSTSSMLPPIYLQPDKGSKVLDICAAPGSKSTQIAAMMGNTGMLLVNEVQGDRLSTLSYNIERTNVFNAGIIQDKGEWLGRYYQNYFDKILVDVPCSGLGIIQKKDEVNKWWSTSSIVGLINLQLSLIVAAIKMLKPGGELVYSTCTLTTEENEEIINKVLEKYPIELLPVSIPGGVPGFTEVPGKKFSPELSKTARVLPWLSNSEGFFLAKMVKTDLTEKIKSAEPPLGRNVLKSFSKVKPSISSIINNFGIDEQYLATLKYPDHGKKLFFVSGDWDDTRTGIYERIGLKLGSYEKHDQIILNSIAAQSLSQYITKGTIDLDNQIDLRTYMEGGTVKEYACTSKTTGAERQVIIRSAGEIIGVGVLTERGLKSQFPRGHRNQNFRI